MQLYSERKKFAWVAREGAAKDLGPYAESSSTIFVDNFLCFIALEQVNVSLSKLSQKFHRTVTVQAKDRIVRRKPTACALKQDRAWMSGRRIMCFLKRVRLLFEFLILCVDCSLMLLGVLMK